MTKLDSLLKVNDGSAVCKDCVHFGTTIKNIPGECRRYPPVVDQRQKLGKWPLVLPTSWCGEYRLIDVERHSDLNVLREANEVNA